MSIVVDEKTPVIVQGFTGRMGTFHAEEMIEYGTNVVGGIAPGKSGSDHLGLPVFDTVRDAVNETGAEASIVFVPPPFAADAIMEAADAGISQCVCITDGIPAQDMMKVKRYMRTKRVERRMNLMGPNCAGVISPGKAMLGIMPGHIYLQGPVGIIGRSGTLGYEAASQLKAIGIGVSTSVGIGGDPSTAVRSPTTSNPSNRTPRPPWCASSARSAAPRRPRPPSSLGTTCTRRWWPTSPACRHQRAGPWVTPEPS